MRIPGKTEEFFREMPHDTIHNIVGKDLLHERVQPSGTRVTQKKTSYDWTYTYGSPQPHAPSLIGDRAYSYDANGNQTGWDHVSNGTRRTIVWDEENRIQEVSDNGHTKTYKYDDAGERVIKRGPQGETAYINQFFTMRNREVGTKHVFAGGTRLVSKLVKAPNVVDLDGDGIPDDMPNACSEPWGWTNGNGGQGNANGICNGNAGGNGNGNGGSGPEVFEKDQYYYHPDHLGSSSYVTDLDGEIFQHLEYFPFGETWVEEHSNTQRTPYLFTSKELDEETGLYYFGARYYDPRTSVWQSTDPILASYLGGSPAKGVFAPPNLNLYAYVQQRPVIAKDPDGNVCVNVVAAGSISCVNSPAGSGEFSLDSGWSPTADQQSIGETLVIMDHFSEFRSGDLAYSLSAAGNSGRRDALLNQAAAAAGEDVAGRSRWTNIAVASGGTSGLLAYGRARAARAMAPNSARTLFSNNRPGDAVRLENTPRLLVEDNGRYWLVGRNGNRITPSGSYDFVTMPNGTVLVARGNRNPEFSTHLGLSNGGDVAYAGSIRFANNDGPNRGSITRWSNNSGHYTPSEGAAGQAGLPMDRFVPRE